MGCVAECSPDLVQRVVEGCVTTFMNGGLYKLAFMKCDKDFDDVSGGVITDVSRWADMIDADEIIVSDTILGSKGEVSVTSIRTNSCQPEIPTGGTMPFAFEDFNADTTGFNHIIWWRQIQRKYNLLKFMAITCEGYVYGPFDNGTWSIVASEVRENTKETPTKIAGTITVAEYELQVPVFVSGLIGLI